MNTKKLHELLAYINQRLATTGLLLSPVGVAEVTKRFAKKESDGGYSDYWTKG